MSELDGHFFPEQVEEQIGALTQADETLSRNAHLIADLYAVYQEDEEIVTLVWTRLAKRANISKSRSIEQTNARDHLFMRTHSPKGPLLMRSSFLEEQSLKKQKEQKQSRLSTFGRRISILVAIVVMGVLVGSLVLVMNAAHQKTAQRPHQHTQTGAAQTPQKSASTFGKTVYTNSDTDSIPGFYALAWSPDSTRVASLSSNLTNPVTIWDATTGKHSVTVPLSNAGGAGPLSLSWSPDSQLVAIGTDTGVIIANGQTGAIVKNYSISMVAATLPPVGSGSYLSARMPASSGAGVWGLAWSPDGNALAVSVQQGPNGKFLVLNAQTGAKEYELPVQGSFPGTPAWSSDGKYLAVYMQKPLADAAAGMVSVWNTATKQMVFQHAGLNASESTRDYLAWSPNGDILAFGGQKATVTLWNAPTNQVTSYQANVAGPLAWSPDGKYIAFVDSSPFSHLVNVIDATNGKLVYEYAQMDTTIQTLAWSPDGKYIASGASDAAKVWTAE